MRGDRAAIASIWISGAALALLLKNCVKEPESTSKTTNDRFDVQLLFEHDGCRAYRFYDAQERKYYVHCPAGQASTQQERHHSTGKTHWTEREEIPTIQEVTK